MKKVAFFNRVSTLDQHSSVENQGELFKNWLKRNTNCVEYKTYTDEGISGAKSYKRKEWLQMIEDGLKQKYDIIVAKSFSRFGRNQSETLEVIKDLREKNIRIIFLEDSLDSSHDNSKFGLFAWLAEQEIQKTSDRIKLIWDGYNEQGKIHNASPAYGYDYDIETKNFIINNEEAKTVRRVFDMYLKGDGLKRIALTLDKELIRTKRGGKWDSNTINNMVRNEVYVGTLVQGKTRTIDVTRNKLEKKSEEEWVRHFDNHPAIIDKDIFSKVQEEFNIRSKKTMSSRLSHHSSVSLFSNLAKCGECGSAMSRRRKKTLQYKNKYFCNQFVKLGTKCGHSDVAIYEEVLIDYVYDKLNFLVENNYEELTKKINKGNNKEGINIVKKELVEIERQIQKQSEVGNRLLSLLIDGTIQEEQYSVQNETVAKAINELVIRKKNKGLELEKINSIEERTKILTKDIDSLLNLEKEEWTNQMLKEIINRVDVYRNGTIEIDFKY